MFREFFFSPSPRTTCHAWGFALLITLGTLVNQLLFLKLALWQASFYNEIQQMLLDGRSASDASAQIGAMIVDYMKILSPAIVIGPAIGRFTRHYTLTWRFVLTRSYLRGWDGPGGASGVEGASQRVQEDTSKFADGVNLIFREIVNAVFAIAVFTPTLADVGSKIAPVFVPASFGSTWLVTLAVGLAAVGLIVASFAARSLVRIDVDNQRVEAHFRKRLVEAETSEPEAGHGASLAAKAVPSGRPPTYALLGSLEPQLRALFANYNEMYDNLISIDAWNA